MTDNEAVLRDLLLEMGVRGAECITPFALACLADYMQEKSNNTYAGGGWPRWEGGTIRVSWQRSRWSDARFGAVLGCDFDINQLHAEALELSAD